MAQVISIPVTTAQSFPVSLMVDGANLVLNLTMRYSKIAGYWLLAIADAQSNLLLDSIPLLTGDYPAANMLAPYAYLAIGSVYVINASSSSNDTPDSTGFVTGEFQLLWGDTAH